jgi:hypothetical protein
MVRLVRMLKKVIFVSFCCFIGVSLVRAAADDDSYKGDFIAKLPSYVEWPAGKGAAADGGVTIGVVGKCTALDQLRAAAAQRTGDGKKTTVKELTADADFTGCQIVFFQTQDKSELAKILKKVSSQPILTVSDCTGFAGFGTMINFYTETEDGKAKVKFEINAMAASDSKLKISSSLLKLARVI